MTCGSLYRLISCKKRSADPATRHAIASCGAADTASSPDVFALRRESLLEFPDASISDDDSVQAHVVRSPAAEIAQLRELRDSGAITDAEFERGKQLALSRD